MKHQLKYRYRLLAYFFVFLAFVALAFMVWTSRQSRGFSITNLQSELKTANEDIYGEISKGANLQNIEPPAKISFTLLDTNGCVIYDNTQMMKSYIVDQSDMSEIANAIIKGEGSALRSDINNDEYLFYAKKYDDIFLRTSIKFTSKKPSDIAKDNKPIFLIASLLVAMVIAFILIIRVINKPVKNFHEFLSAIKSNKKDFSNIEFGNDDFGTAGKEIAAAFEQLEKSKLYKQQMSHNIAHELKTPVTGIRAYLETILHNGDMDADQMRKFVEKAYNQTVRLSKLVMDVSTINKLDEGGDMYQIEEVNISGVLNDVMEEIGYKLEANNITFESLISKRLKLNGCYTLIYSLFKNLIDNTIEHGGGNCKISLSAGIRQFAGDSGYRIDFKYTDTGKGVPPEALERIFERFYRIEEGRTRKKGGSGLGLSIVKNAVAFHKGNITASVREGGGIVFKFSLYSL